LAILTVLCVGLVSCGDSDSKYISTISNNTSYDVIVRLHLSEDSMIVCPSKQETIIVESWASSVKKFSCMTLPNFLRSNIAEIIIEGGNKIITKDILDYNNWNCSGEEDWNLIMVGSYYSKITTTFVINDEDIEDVEQ
jgi:hypothetical protein